jgi:hypothetical protein
MPHISALNPTFIGFDSYPKHRLSLSSVLLYRAGVVQAAFIGVASGFESIGAAVVAAELLMEGRITHCTSEPWLTHPYSALNHFHCAFCWVQPGLETRTVPFSSYDCFLSKYAQIIVRNRTKIISQACSSYSDLNNVITYMLSNKNLWQFNIMTNMLKSSIFWDMTPCTLIKVLPTFRRNITVSGFKVSCCLLGFSSTQKMKTVVFVETTILHDVRWQKLVL